MQLLKINQYDHLPIIQRFCGLIIGVLLPLIMGFSIDDIDIAAIQDLQLRQENGVYALDTIITLRNLGKSTLKLVNCTFDLAIAVNDSETIPLGQAVKDHILLESNAAETGDAPSGTDVPLTVNLGRNIQNLSQALLTKKEIALLLVEPKPRLNLRVRARFDLGVKATQAWGYQPGMSIDWVVKPEIRPQVLAGFVSALTAALNPTAASAAPQAATPPEPQAVTTPELQAAATPTSPPAKETTAAVQIAGTPEIAPPPDSGKRVVIYFAVGSITLNDADRETLQQWAKQQELSNGASLHIEGHTDSSGSPERNLAISVKRAGAVYCYLTNTLGVTWPQTVVKGFGGDQPAAPAESNDTAARNRRVELYVSAP